MLSWTPGLGNTLTNVFMVLLLVNHCARLKNGMCMGARMGASLYFERTSHQEPAPINIKPHCIT